MSKKQDVTIKDIAQKVGISIATVGRALGGYGRVSAATREKVLSAAKELEFQPNVFARSLKGKATNTIGLLIANIRVPFFSLLARAVEDSAIEKGFSVFVCNIDEDQEKERAYLSLLRSKRVDGLIVCSAFANKKEMRGGIGNIYEHEIPTVFLDRHVDGMDRPSVQIDNLGGTLAAVDYLISLGHKRIGVCSHDPGTDTLKNRILGYRQALENRGIPFDPSLVATKASHTSQDGYDTAKALLSRKDRPTALLTTNALITYGALPAIKDLRLSIPGDLSLLAWDDFELSTVLTPAITVITQPTYSLGSIATGILFDMINKKGPQESVVLSPRLVIRESCAALPAKAADK